jgi:GT2 family glycosyltransferase
MKTVAIVVLNYNTPEMTDALAAYLSDQLEYPEKDVWLVDNGSSPPLEAKITPRLRQDVLTLPSNLGFTRGMDEAYRFISSHYRYDAYWFLNSDVLFDHGNGVLNDLMEILFSSEEYAQIAPQHNSPHAHMNDATGDAQPVPFLESTATLVKTTTIEKIGFWDLECTLGWGVDYDYGWRVRQAGLKNILTSRARVTHLEHRSQANVRDYAKRANAEMERVLTKKYGANWSRILSMATPAVQGKVVRGTPAPPPDLAGAVPLDVCAIFRNEAPYLREWIEFHRMMGVERFHLYENRSSDAWRPVLEPYIAEGIVDLKNWPMNGAAQLPAYRDCFLRLNGQKRWLAVIDIDEFLFSPKFPTVPEALATLPAHWGAVGVHWIIFGASGREEFSPEPVIERFTWRPPESFHVNSHIKSVIRMDRQVMARGDAHYFQVQGGTFDEKGGALSSARPPRNESSLLRIHHYCTKSRQEYYDRIALGRVDGAGSVQKSVFEERQERAFDDRTAWMFLPELKRRLGVRA